MYTRVPSAQEKVGGKKYQSPHLWTWLILTSQKHNQISICYLICLFWRGCDLLLLLLLLIFSSLLIVITADGYHMNETRPYVPRRGVRKDPQRVDLCPPTKWKQGQTSATLATLLLSFLLLFPLSLLSVTPFTRFSLLSLANSSPRDRVIDKSATITSTRTKTPAWITERTDTTQEDAQKNRTGPEDWQTGHKSETLQWLAVTTFDWQLVGSLAFFKHALSN